MSEKTGEAPLAARLMALYAGNTRSRGSYDPSRQPPNKTIQLAPSIADFESHLSGDIGVGVAPVRDDDTVIWAAIDIDAHHGKPPIDLPMLVQLIESQNLPLLVCRSKSGGAHVYMFMKEPTPAPKVRRVLASWAAAIGHTRSEVFPKQDALGPDPITGERSLGSWLNLPYYGGDKTDRYCWHKGRRLTLIEFMDLADTMRESIEWAQNVKAGDHPDAPPCIQALLAQGVSSGNRNEALFNMTVYAKKAFPDKYREHLLEWNQHVFEEPLDNAEAKSTINSAARREYKYRCSQKPLCDLCDSAVCITRKFGISGGEKEALDNYRLPVFGQLDKHTTEPVIWRIEIDGIKIRTSTPDLVDYNRLRIHAADYLTRMIPPMKQSDWHIVLDALMKKATIVEESPEARAAGMLRVKLSEFLRRADQRVDPGKLEHRNHLLRGIPVIVDIRGIVMVAFRGIDLVEFLRKNRADELAGPRLWLILRELGAEASDMKIQGRKQNVWCIPHEQATIEYLTTAGMQPEF